MGSHHLLFGHKSVIWCWSADLVNWTHHPAAIEPNGLGSVFSGSSAVDTENSAGFGKDAVVAMYTSAGVSQYRVAWSVLSAVTLSVMISGFCSSSHDFAIASSFPRVAPWNLRVALGFVGNYATCGLSPQMHGMPIIQEKTLRPMTEGVFCGFIDPFGDPGEAQRLLYCNIYHGSD